MGTVPKLSPSLKALVNAPSARPDARRALAKIADVYQTIAREAAQRRVGIRPWVTLSAATTFTLNSPDALLQLHHVASAAHPESAIPTAELIREVGLKAISFNGIPRSIICLNAFHAGLPPSIRDALRTTSTRDATPANLPSRHARGRALWDSVYAPYADKLYGKLGASHPDLPVHILQSHYAWLLSDPPAVGGVAGAGVGRVLTSLVAIACLRAQTGVGPQVLSHVYGLRKALADGSYREDAVVEEEETVRWLAGDEGSEWVLKTVDAIVEAFGGSNFAPGMEGAKL